MARDVAKMMEDPSALACLQVCIARITEMMDSHRCCLSYRTPFERARDTQEDDLNLMRVSSKLFPGQEGP